MPEIRIENDKILCNIHILVYKDHYEEHDIADTQSQQTLMEGDLETKYYHLQKPNADSLPLT